MIWTGLIILVSCAHKNIIKDKDVCMSFKYQVIYDNLAHNNYLMWVDLSDSDYLGHGHHYLEAIIYLNLIWTEAHYDAY